MTRGNDEERFERARLVFHDALDVPAAERDSYLDEVCIGDPDLLAEVRDLLQHFERSEDSFDSAVMPQIAADSLAGIQLGRYLLEERLGEGGMGVVYRAKDDTGDEVALKVLRPDLSSHATATRFRLEIQTLSRLKGEGIARLLDAGSAEHEGRKLNYYAMELVEGQNLRSLNLTDVRQIVTLIANVCEAVGVAHEHGVVHRDIKPENIIVRADGRPVVLDFGISRMIDPDGRTTNFVTSTGHVLGTVTYMSPEQLMGDSAAMGAHSDVYSLGVLAFELLTGSRPYDRKKGLQSSVLTQASVLRAIEREDVPLASSRRPELGPKLDAILCQALQPTTKDRYDNAITMARDLRSYLAGGRIRAPRQTLLRRGWSRVRRAPRRTLISSVVGLAVVVIGGGAALLVQDRQESHLVDLKLAELWSVLQDVEQDLHPEPGGRTEESVYRALDNLQRSRMIVDSMPRRPFQPRLLRFIDWRSGEARYFLGAGTQDVKQYRLALSHWVDAHNLHNNQDQSLDGLPRGRLFVAIAYLDNVVSMGGRALASAAIATYENRAEHLRVAAYWRSRAFESISDRRNWELLTGNKRNVARLAILDCSISLVAYGIAVDSLSVVDRGAEYFKLIDDEKHWTTRRSAFASGQFEIGVGAMYRWQQSGSPEDWTEAERRFRLSLGIRGEGSGSPLHVRDRLKLADLHLLAGREKSLADEARAHFVTARKEIIYARDQGNLTPGSFRRAGADQLEAEITAEIGRLDRDSEALARAESLLVAAETVYVRRKYPLQHAALQLSRIFVLEASESVTGTRETEIQGALTTIEVIVPGKIWPRLLHQAQEHRSQN